jgi:hypothetical protein
MVHELHELRLEKHKDFFAQRRKEKIILKTLRLSALARDKGQK